ncbi:YgjV family protein [Candidatus Saccharibacteria bacterium]|nr:YgjV family protein [Candidatus Saccharibacteria bacterium]
MINFILAQLFGALAALACIISVQFRDKRHIIYMLITETLLNAVALTLLGAWGGLTTNLISLLPALYIYYMGRKKKKPHLLMIIPFLLVLVAGWGVVYSGWFDILPLIGSSVYTIALFLKKEKNIRQLLVVNRVVWLGYDLIFGLLSAAVFDASFLISDTIALYRFRHGHKKSHRASRHWWKSFFAN